MTESPDESFGLLPEEAAPPHVRQCDRCELSGQRTRVVWGEGNPNAPIMLILDNPGAREDREGRPFLCGTRETLLRGMKEAGLETEDVYVTYLLKCRPIRAYDKPLARQTCAAHLHLQIRGKRPRLLFGFGDAVAGSLFPSQDNNTVKAMRGSWRTYMDIPVGFTYHPLAVRRRPNLMGLFVKDLAALAARWQELAPGAPSGADPEGAAGGAKRRDGDRS